MAGVMAEEAELPSLPGGAVLVVLVGREGLALPVDTTVQAGEEAMEGLAALLFFLMERLAPPAMRHVAERAVIFLLEVLLVALAARVSAAEAVAGRV